MTASGEQHHPVFRQPIAWDAVSHLADLPYDFALNRRLAYQKAAS